MSYLTLNSRVTLVTQRGILKFTDASTTIRWSTTGSLPSPTTKKGLSSPTRSVGTEGSRGVSCCGGPLRSPRGLECPAPTLCSVLSHYQGLVVTYLSRDFLFIFFSRIKVFVTFSENTGINTEWEDGVRFVTRFV